MTRCDLVKVMSGGPLAAAAFGPVRALAPNKNHANSPAPLRGARRLACGTWI